MSTDQPPKVQLRGANNADVIAFDSARNRWTPASPTAGSAPTASLTNAEGFTLEAGRPVYVFGSGSAKRGTNTSQAASKIVGLLKADTATTMPAEVQTSGKLVLPTATWDVVTGGSGGLTPAAEYYLGASGALTTTPPSALGSSVTKLGVALTATDMELEIANPILL